MHHLYNCHASTTKAHFAVKIPASVEEPIHISFLALTTKLYISLDQITTFLVGEKRNMGIRFLVNL
jgi:hypothetical protein